MEPEVTRTHSRSVSRSKSIQPSLNISSSRDGRSNSEMPFSGPELRSDLPTLAIENANAATAPSPHEQPSAAEPDGASTLTTSDAFGPIRRRLERFYRLADHALMKQYELEHEQDKLENCRRFLEQSTSAALEKFTTILSSNPTPEEQQSLVQERERMQNDHNAFKTQSSRLNEVRAELTQLQDRLKSGAERFAGYLNLLKNLPLSSNTMGSLDALKSETQSTVSVQMSTASAPSLMVRFWELQGEINVMAERSEDLEAQHREDIAKREFLRERGDVVDISDEQFEAQFTASKEKIMASISGLQMQQDDIADQCEAEGLDPYTDETSSVSESPDPVREMYRAKTDQGYHFAPGDLLTLSLPHRAPLALDPRERKTIRTWLSDVPRESAQAVAHGEPGTPIHEPENALGDLSLQTVETPEPAALASSPGKTRKERPRRHKQQDSSHEHTTSSGSTNMSKGSLQRDQVDPARPVTTPTEPSSVDSTSIDDGGGGKQLCTIPPNASSQAQTGEEDSRELADADTAERSTTKSSAPEAFSGSTFETPQSSELEPTDLDHSWEASPYEHIFTSTGDLRDFDDNELNFDDLGGIGSDENLLERLTGNDASIFAASSDPKLQDSGQAIPIEINQESSVELRELNLNELSDPSKIGTKEAEYVDGKSTDSLNAVELGPEELHPTSITDTGVSPHMHNGESRTKSESSDCK